MKRNVLFLFVVCVTLAGCLWAEDDLFTCPYPVTFCEDFDGACDPDSCQWSFSGGTWDWSSDILSVTPQGRKKAIARPLGVYSGPTSTVEASMRTSGGLYSRAWLLSWYVDAQNKVELLMRQDTGTWVLKHRVNGVIRAKGKGRRPIAAGVLYHTKINYAGSAFLVYVDDMLAPLFTIPSSTPASGLVGLEAKNSPASFGYLMVD